MTRRRPVTIGIIFVLFLSGMEISAVGTAAPRIAAELGGLGAFSWLFSIYLLTSTLTMPLWGRAADWLGRKHLLLFAIVLFLFGNILCAIAPSMSFLIFGRAIKGLGGGGLVPIGFTIIADLYDKTARAKVQGWLSSAWGVASVIGPFVGGLLADTWGWRAVFWISLLPGFAALILIGTNLKEKIQTRSAFDVSAASLITSSLAVGLFLLSLKAIQSGLLVIAGALMLLTVFAGLAFYQLEQQVAHPLIPADLLKRPVFINGCASGFFASILVIGLGSFVPLFLQTCYKYSATASGLMLVPFSLSWVFFGILSARAMIKHEHRRLMLGGLILTTTGFAIFLASFDHLTSPLIISLMLLMGAGMGFNYPVVLIAVQHDAPPERVAFATAGLIWIRNIGATAGTTMMGVTMGLILRTRATHSQLTLTTPENILRPEALKQLATDPILAQTLNYALFWAFFLMGLAIAFALIITWQFPRHQALGQKKP